MAHGSMHWQLNFYEEPIFNFLYSAKAVKAASVRLDIFSISDRSHILHLYCLMNLTE